MPPPDLHWLRNRLMVVLSGLRLMRGDAAAAGLTAEQLAVIDEHMTRLVRTLGEIADAINDSEGDT